MITSAHATNPLIRLFRNTDQRIDVLVKTIDRKPVTLGTNEVIRMRVHDSDGKRILDQQCLVDNAPKGHYYLNLTKEQTGSYDVSNYTWSMVVLNTVFQTERLLFSDKDFGGTAPLKVIEGPIPPEKPAQRVAVESLIDGATEALQGAAQTRNIAGTHSLVLALTAYTGTVTLQATLDPDIPLGEQEWTTVKTVDLVASSGNAHIALLGNYTWVRAVFSTSVGLNGISFRNL